MELTDYEIRALEKLDIAIINGKWSNDGMVQLIERVGSFLNPTSIQAYADRYGKSYNGIKKTKKTTILLGNTYIIDND